MKIPQFNKNQEQTKTLFSKGFFSEFSISLKDLPFKEEELEDFEKKITAFEKTNITSETEDNLITKNELLSSFAISKAENSELSLDEANSIYNEIQKNPSFNFLAEKINKKKNLSQNDHDKLEFFNILQVFRKINNQKSHADFLSLTNILNLHKELTQGLDIFQKYLPRFDLYHSGQLRNSDEIIVGNYIPPDFSQIKTELKKLFIFFKEKSGINTVAIFHTLFYALHPFSNGNKRVSRILEHLLFRTIGLNQKNLYSTSYYYHMEKERYYKYLLLSLQRKNLNYFVSFVQESLFFSQLSIVKAAIETARIDFVKNGVKEKRIKKIVEPLVKQKTMQYKNLFKIARRKLKIAEQTFVTDLKKAIDEKYLIKLEAGKKTFYQLNLKATEEKWYSQLILFAKNKIKYIPHEFNKLIV